MDEVKLIWDSKAKFHKVVEIKGSLREELKDSNNNELKQLRNKIKPEDIEYIWKELKPFRRIEK